MATKNTKPIASEEANISETSNIMVTLPLSIRKKVQALGKKEHRSMSYLCRQFIEQGLNNVKNKSASK